MTANQDYKMAGAIFDMDGLLLDSEKLFQKGWQAMAEQYGATLDETFPAQISGCGYDQAAKVLNKYWPGVDPKILSEGCRAMVYKLEETCLELKPGVIEILTGFREAGFKMAVASSSMRLMITKNMKNMGLYDFFDAIICGADAEKGKPFPDIFLKAAEALGLPPETCYVFEDSLNGIIAAHAAGSRAVMIPDLVAPTEEIKKICLVYPDLGAAWSAIKDKIKADNESARML